MSNYLGNHDDVPYRPVLAILVLGGTVGDIFYAPKLFRPPLSPPPHSARAWHH